MAKTLSQATSRLWTDTVDPGVSETGVELGNWWLNTATASLFLCTDPTGGAQVWAAQPSGNPLSVPHGGTGATTLTGFVIGNGASAFTATAGKLIIQQIRSSTNATDSTNVIIPEDSTIPQNTEGKELLTVTITPSNSSNILHIYGLICWSNASNVNTWALFQDSANDALAAGGEFVASGVVSTTPYHFYMAAGTTSATTFKLRYGPATASTAVINQDAAGNTLGGVPFTFLIAEEIQV